MREPTTTSPPPQTESLKPGLDAITRRYDACSDPIFVGGLMRSGTTLVMKLLLAHPECVGLNLDAHLVGSLLETWKSHEETADVYTSINLAVGHDSTRLHHFIRSNYFFMCEHLDLPVTESRLVEKTPGSEGLFARLLPIFPQASLVTTLRHPHATMRSMLAHALLFGGGPLHHAHVPAGLRQEAFALATRSLRCGTDDRSAIQFQAEIRIHFSRLLKAMVNSLVQLQSIAEQLGDRLIVMNFDELTKDLDHHTQTLFERCGLDASPATVRQAIDDAGRRGEEKVFWRGLMDWSEMEFERRFGWTLTDSQKTRLDRDVIPIHERLVDRFRQ